MSRPPDVRERICDPQVYFLSPTGGLSSGESLPRTWKTRFNKSVRSRFYLISRPSDVGERISDPLVFLLSPTGGLSSREPLPINLEDKLQQVPKEQGASDV